MSTQPDKQNPNITKKTIEGQKFLLLIRVLGVFICVAFISNIILFISFYGILPNTQIQPIYLYLKDMESKDIYITKKFDRHFGKITSEEAAPYYIYHDTPAYNTVKRLLTKYVIDRETIKPGKSYMNNLWGEDSDIFFMSTEDIYKNFSSKNLFKTAIAGVYQYMTNISVKEVIYQPKIQEWNFKVDITTQDLAGQVINQNIKNITIKAAFNAEILKRNTRTKFKNPLGLIVTFYEYE